MAQGYLKSVYYAIIIIGAQWLSLSLLYEARLQVLLVFHNYTFVQQRQIEICSLILHEARLY